ncbi:hypothetical protein [Sphingomonas sp. GC_Shp_3]|uniref:hypothetical protein n=1 Tax=Sphingomonas sp. GC_Shp_3 TaxID=2937383 RepID=UPI00226A7ABA|nr:hypothetical protein [Sphingomonas sp. GC_Shp_3]
MRSFEIFDFWLIACMVPPLWKGGGPERTAAVLIGIAVIVTKLAVEGMNLTYQTANPIVVLLDIALAAALFGLALKANRMWTMLLASLQLCVVMGHIAKLALTQLDPLAYYVILTKWAYLITALPAVGAIRHQLRLRSFKVDQSWSPSR